MAEEATTTTPAAGDTTATTDASTQAPASTTAPTEPANGSEADNNSSNEAMVPSHRVREATEARRKAEEERDAAQRELEELRSKQSQTPAQTGDDDEEIDVDVEKLVEPILKKRGYVTQEELRAAEAKRQYDSDVASLTAQYAESGVPFVAEDVRQYAKDNGINITSKASLKAAYLDMNADKILEAERNKAIAEFKENGSSTTAERPGGSGPELPAEKKVEGNNPKERLMSRIRIARSS